MRRDVYEAHRWIAQSADSRRFTESQRRSYADLYETAALKTMLPWLTAHVEQVQAERWARTTGPTDFARNEATLRTFLRYHFEQGLSKRLLEPAELFAPESLEAFKI